VTDKLIRVLNLGAGIQSTVLYLMNEYDYAIFADTQEEPESVYQHLKWLQGLRKCPILIGSNGSLGENLKGGMNADGGRFISIPAFTKHEDEPGDHGIMRRQCTSEYKIDVIQKVLRERILGLKRRQRVPAGVHVEQNYGISIDEAGRAMRIQRNWELKWSRPRFPLLEKFWSRRDCKAWLENYGVPHQVPRSACVFCPYKSNYEWRLLRDHDPAGWARALEIDAALRTTAVAKRGMREEIYLHSSCLPLGDADIDNDAYGAQYTLGFATECTGGCGL
jgi:hypothetical protein